jgi:hypothetical protein
MAKDFKCCDATIRNVLHKDLGLRTYRKIPVPKLNQGHIDKRKTCCIWMRKNISRDLTKKMMWTDEKIFTTNGMLNLQNFSGQNLVRQQTRMEASLKRRNIQRA